MTALQSLRDLGQLGEGGKALTIGAGGGIGSVAVGIGKRLGVCSTKDVERVGALGGDAIIDRKKSDPLDAESAYDVVFDTPPFTRSAAARRSCGPAAPTSRRCQVRPWSPAWGVRCSPPSAVDSFKSPPGKRTRQLAETLPDDRLCRGALRCGALLAGASPVPILPARVGTQDEPAGDERRLSIQSQFSGAGSAAHSYRRRHRRPFRCRAPARGVGLGRGLDLGADRGERSREAVR